MGVKKLNSQVCYIGLKKEDSAFFHRILESYEGIANCTTLDGVDRLGNLTLRVRIPPGRETEFTQFLECFEEQIDGEIVRGRAQPI